MSLILLNFPAIFVEDDAIKETGDKDADLAHELNSGEYQDPFCKH